VSAECEQVSRFRWLEINNNAFRKCRRNNSTTHRDHYRQNADRHAVICYNGYRYPPP